MKFKTAWLNWRKIIIDDRSLSFGAKGVALYLNTYMNDSHDMAFPAISRIRGELNIGSNTTVIKYLNELELKGYLQRQKRFSKTTIYHATIPPSITDPVVLQNMDSSITESVTPVLQNLEPNKQGNKQSNKQLSTFTADDHDTACWMWGLIHILQPNRKTPDLDKWAATISKIRRLDNRKPSDIHDLFRWANRDDFWQLNILSPEKLRKQWDQLELKSRADQNGGQLRIKVPSDDDQLVAFAKTHGLSGTRAGENYYQYRWRLNNEIERRST